MKTKLEATRRIASVIAIAIITLALVGLSSTGCDNGNNTPSHVHEWGDWIVTTPPTTTAEGVETRTCATCGEKETRPIAKLPNTDPHDQTATITLFEGKTAIIKGNFTDAEWGSGATGIAGKIEAAINAIFDLIPSEDATKDKWRTAFDRGVKIEVQASPVGYTNWKTIGDGKTIYFSLAATNSANPGNLIAPAITSLSNNGSGYVKAVDNSRNTVRMAAIQPKQDRVHAG